MAKLRKNEIVIEDVYSWEELESLIPYGAEYIYNISIDKYGYLHDVGTKIVLTLCRNGEEPQGWKTAKSDFEKIVENCKWCWETAANFAYH